MKQKYFFFLRLFVGFLLFSVSFTSCDSGDIYPVDPDTIDGTSISASFRFLHTETYPVSYEVLFGAFGDSEVPIVSKTVPKPSNDGAIIVSLSNIPEGSTTIRLSLSKSGRNAFYTLYEMKLDGLPAEDIVVSEQTINLLQYGRLQQQVFTQCVACHGGSDYAAAGLNLTADLSFDNIVDVPSEEEPSSKKRVEPNNVAGSFLIDVLKGQAGLTYNHSTGISSLKDDDIVLLEEWIRNGAKNE